MRSRTRKSNRTLISVGYEDDDDDFEYEEGIFGMSPFSASMASSSYAMNQQDWKPVKPLKARNEHQATYLKALSNPQAHIVVAAGAAGTGKTFIASSFAMESLKRNDYAKIVLTRPMVSVDDRGFGALPGDVQAKMMPFLLPLYDTLHKYVTPQKLQSMISKGMIEICALVHMRGRSFENALIIADEMQNATPTQMLMLLTRIGDKSKLVINGDPMQHDQRTDDTNGLTDLIKRLERHPQTGIEVVKFSEEDVERHPIIKNILKMYSSRDIRAAMS